MFGIEDFPASESVADEFVFVEGPDDLAVFVEFNDLGILIASVAVADDEVAIGKFLKVGGPGEFDVGAGDFLFHFPDDFFVGGDFENGAAAAGSDEGVSVLEADGSEDAGLGFIFPENFAVGVVFGDDAGILGAGKVVAVRENFEHAGLVTTVFGEGDFLGDLACVVEVDDTANSAFGDHGVSVGKALEGVDVGSFGVVFPNDFLLRSNLGGDGPGVVKEDVAVGEELDVMVAGVVVGGFGAAGFVFPNDGAVGFADREDVFAIGSADEDEAVFFGKEGDREKEKKGDELHVGEYEGREQRRSNAECGIVEGKGEVLLFGRWHQVAVLPVVEFRLISKVELPFPLFV